MIEDSRFFGTTANQIRIIVVTLVQSETKGVLAENVEPLVKIESPKGDQLLRLLNFVILISWSQSEVIRTPPKRIHTERFF